MIKRVGEGDNDVNACDSYGDTNSNYNYSELLIPRTCRADDQDLLKCRVGEDDDDVADCNKTIKDGCISP